MSETYYFDGVKATSIADLPDSAWSWYSPHTSEEAESVKEYHKRVPWLYRGTDLRAKAIAHLPFSIVDGAGNEIDSSEDYQNRLGFLPNPSKLFELIEASLTLLGRAYLFRLQNRVKVLGLRYVLAQSVTPVIDQEQGLVGFNRQLATGTLSWTVDDVVHFWLPDPWTEIGPPSEDRCPGMAALTAAGVLHNLGKYASAYFARGAIRPMIMTVPTKPTPAEESRIKAWLKRLFLGVDNAYSAHIFEKDTTFENIGDGLGELSDSNLTREQREDIATALGIPQTLLWSTEASGLGGGGVTDSDERKFYQNIIPEAQFIAGEFNEQLLTPLLGYRLVFRPETLDIFQEDESQRAQALTQYVNAGMRLGVAAEILGVELPEGMDYGDLDTMREEDKEQAAERQRQAFEQRAQAQPPQNQAQREAAKADLNRWRTKALKAGGVVPFESEFIPAALMESINGAIAELGVEAAFAFLKKKS